MCISQATLMYTSSHTRCMSLLVTVLGALSTDTVPVRDSILKGVLGSHVIIFIFILRGTGLLGGAGRRCCHLCLLGGLLHLQPLLLGKFCLLLPCLHTQQNHDWHETQKGKQRPRLVKSNIPLELQHHCILSKT